MFFANPNTKNHKHTKKITFVDVVLLTCKHQTDVPSDTSGSYVTATAVTTRTATTHEDLSTNAKTQQLEEKTVATTTKQIADRQDVKVITQEVKTTVTSGEQVSFRYETFELFFMLEKKALSMIFPIFSLHDF
jgi:hypothetical protein